MGFSRTLKNHSGLSDILFGCSPFKLHLSAVAKLLGCLSLSGDCPYGLLSPSVFNNAMILGSYDKEAIFLLPLPVVSYRITLTVNNMYRGLASMTAVHKLDSLREFIKLGNLRQDLLMSRAV